MRHYIGGFLIFAGLLGFALSLFALTLALTGFGIGSMTLAVSVLAGWLGAECVERAERGLK